MDSAMNEVLLQNKYRVGKIINSGNQGYIFDVEDTTGNSFQKDEMVIKFSNDYMDSAYEIKVLVKI